MSLSTKPTRSLQPAFAANELSNLNEKVDFRRKCHFDTTNADTTRTSATARTKPETWDAVQKLDHLIFFRAGARELKRIVKSGTLPENDDEMSKKSNFIKIQFSPTPVLL